MKTITVGHAQVNLDRLLEEVTQSGEPVRITGKAGNAVLVSEQGWRSLEETVYLLSIPGTREAIREGLETPLEECYPGPEFRPRPPLL